MLVRLALVAIAAVAGARAGRVDRVEHRESAMVRIPAGTFAMGFPGTEAEHREILDACSVEFGELAEYYCKAEYIILDASPRHWVYLPEFELDRHEVTVGRYRACAAAGGCDVAALVSGDTGYVEDDRLPMVNVTWQDAVDYCAWVGKRLPTEAEWEKAARGSDERRWPWGDHERADGANHGAVDITLLYGVAWGDATFVSDETDGHRYAAPPGSLTWADSPYGAMDLAGNVSEWVADYHVEGYGECRPGQRNCVERSAIDPLIDAPPDGAASLRVYRGGSWAEPRLFGRTYFRAFATPSQRAFDRGFRCARDPSEADS